MIACYVVDCGSERLHRAPLLVAERVREDRVESISLRRADEGKRDASRAGGVLHNRAAGHEITPGLRPRRLRPPPSDPSCSRSDSPIRAWRASGQIPKARPSALRPEVCRRCRQGHSHHLCHAPRSLPSGPAAGLAGSKTSRCATYGGAPDRIKPARDDHSHPIDRVTRLITPAIGASELDRREPLTGRTPVRRSAGPVRAPALDAGDVEEGRREVHVGDHGAVAEPG